MPTPAPLSVPAVETEPQRGGNFRSSWAAEGGYDYVAEALFSELKVDGFFLLIYEDEVAKLSLVVEVAHDVRGNE